MRILVMSDIHANYTALKAVLSDAGTVDETWCLGDLVGYGPDPNAVVEEVQEIKNLTCLMGNHDVAVIGRMSLETFNGDAKRSLMYHEKVLTASNAEFIKTHESKSARRSDDGAWQSAGPVVGIHSQWHDREFEL